MADSTSSASLLNRRRRAMIACTNCRKRKIKCVTTEEPPRHPCARCTKRSLPCEYVAVDEDSPTPESLPLPSGPYYPSSPSYPNYPSSPPGGAYPYQPQSPYGSQWNPPQPAPGYPGQSQAQSTTYRSPSAYGSGHGGNMFVAPAGYGNGQYYQQPFSAPPQNQWAQGSAQQQPRCTCPSQCVYHRRS
ncbi:hypothetical protein DFH09DRAFT_1130278 [Mycena vulgaris]|nr:hypothetical protein DFH09DRAFT_1130278 [Mycena vulgaris]